MAATHLICMGIFYLMNNTGQIVRSRKTGRSRYTPITNDILQSRELTPEEKSILIYLLSMPEDWVVVKSQLFKWANFGRDSVNKAWRGLIEKGYVVSIRVFNSKGQFDGWNHVVYEEPVLDETLQTEETELLKTRESEIPKVGESESRENRSSENQSLYKGINEQSNNYTKDIDNKGEDKKPEKTFVVPTIEEIKEAFPDLDALRFHDFYQSKGWMVGKNKMKDWEAAARNWIRSNNVSSSAGYKKLEL
jgi:hypothetical protein